MQAEAGLLTEFKEDANIVAKAPVVSFKVEKITTKSGCLRGDISICIKRIETSTNRPLLIDAIGNCRIQIKGKEFAEIGRRTSCELG